MRERGRENVEDVEMKEFSNGGCVNGWKRFFAHQQSSSKKVSFSRSRASPGG